MGSNTPLSAGVDLCEREKLARVIAFYLPQFHPIPENDSWWGEGFTEWTNVKKAVKLFPGHKQPRIPGQLGYYDLRDPAVRIEQAALARQGGIEAFCYWHYWFGNGRRLLERPFDEVLRSGKPDFPFCLCWANESWTGVWHGSPSRILMEQTYPGEADEEKHFLHVLPALRDPRYVTVRGMPLFLVYRPDLLPNPVNFVAHWRRLAIDAGLRGLFLVGMGNKIHSKAMAPFDAVLHHGPGDYLSRSLFRKIVRRVLRRALSGKFADYMPGPLERQLRKPARFDYSHVVQTAFRGMPREDRFIPCVLAGWDNTPRSRHRGVVFENFDPELFRKFLHKAVARVANNEPEKRLVFIKAWNEWAEGNYLEPDAEMGTALLDAVRAEVSAMTALR